MKVLDMSWDENPKQSGTAKPTFCLCIFLYTEAEGFFYNLPSIYGGLP